MKQKVVMKVVSMNNPRTRSKALKLVAGVQGVLSAALDGDDKDRIVVIGEDVDSVCLTRLLRKRIGCTELVSVSKAEEKEKEKEKEKDKVKPIVWQTGPPYCVYEDVGGPQPGCESCSIM